MSYPFCLGLRRAAALLLLTLVVPAQATAPAYKLRLAPYTTEGADGQPLVGELGHFTVPENRTRPNGTQIELAFVRFRTTNSSPGVPLVYLVGGPGPSGIDHCVGLATGRRLRVLDQCDVIALDQRGTGRSRPNLEQGQHFPFELPLDRPLTRASFVAAYAAAVQRCVAHWQSAGVDLAAYNTRESAADVEDLRRALALDRIQLWGESYGTHLGLAVLRDFPEHISGATLVRVEGPDHTLKLPSTMQRHFEQMALLVAKDDGFAERFPDLLATVRKLLAALAEKPVTVEALHQGQKVAITLGPFDLQYWLSNVLGLAFEFRDLPANLQRLVEGDWSMLAAHALESRRSEVGSAMALMMDCSSGASPARLRRIAAEANDPANLLGDAVNVPYPDIAAAAGSPDLGEAFRAPFRCDVPVLFVSGAFDARTPPENVAEIAAGFPKHAHVVASSAGHESIERLDPGYRALQIDFLHGRPVQSRTLQLPPVRFRPLAGR